MECLCKLIVTRFQLNIPGLLKKGFNVTVVNRIFPSLHERSLEITHIVPLRKKICDF